MAVEPIQLVAGTVSTLLFVLSNLPMVVRALRTRNLASYSLTHIALSNVGNLLHWLYVLTLPVGPVWVLHGFNSAVAALMLALYLRYERGWALALPAAPPPGPRAAAPGRG